MTVNAVRLFFLRLQRRPGYRTAAQPTSIWSVSLILDDDDDDDLNADIKE